MKKTGATDGGGPLADVPATTVGGATGSGSQAADGVSALGGGMGDLASVLRSLVEAIERLVALLSSGTIGGGGHDSDPNHLPPPKIDPNQIHPGTGVEGSIRFP